MEDDSEWIRHRGDCSVFFGYAQNPKETLSADSKDDLYNI